MTFSLSSNISTSTYNISSQTLLCQLGRNKPNISFNPLLVFLWFRERYLSSPSRRPSSSLRRSHLSLKLAPTLSLLPGAFRVRIKFRQLFMILMYSTSPYSTTNGISLLIMIILLWLICKLLALKKRRGSLPLLPFTLYSNSMTNSPFLRLVTLHLSLSLILQLNQTLVAGLANPKASTALSATHQVGSLQQSKGL